MTTIDREQHVQTIREELASDERRAAPRAPVPSYSVIQLRD